MIPLTQYHEIENTYKLSQVLRQTYNTDKGKGVAPTKLAKRYD